MTEEDKIYYQELHSAARHYDNKLWLGLGSFLVITGWLIAYVDFDYFLSIKNLLMLAIAVVAFFVILVKFVKEHAHAVWIQNKINEFDSQINSKQPENKDTLRGRQPLYSIPGQDKVEFSMDDIFRHLRVRYKKDPYFDVFPMEERIIKMQASRIFIFLTLLAMTLCLDSILIISVGFIHTLRF